MCTKCTTTNQCCQEKLIESPSKGRGRKNAESISNGLINGLIQLSEPIWVLSTKLECMGQVLTKKLHDSGTGSKRLRRVLSNPWFLRAVLVFVAVFYFGIPVAFYFCPWVRRTAVFLHFADWPFQNFSSPESYGLSCTRNFFIETTPGVQLGAWHVMPQNLKCPSTQNYSFENDDRLVVLYLHGSAESRTAAYRRSMYRVLTADPVNAHLITFDYRGFGDSSHVSPTIQTLQEDTDHVYHWLLKQIPASRLVIWGHSLGTGVAIQFGESLAKQNNQPFATVLEAPFTSVADATHTFPLSFFHRRLPLFQQFCSDRTKHPDTHINSEDRIGKLTMPILILHAADDSMVWSDQGKRLWRRAMQERPGHLMAPVFVELDGQHGCGHRNIHRAPDLPEQVVKFFEAVRKHQKN